MADWILGHCPEGGAAAAIEKPHGPEVDALLERGVAVFALNPQAARPLPRPVLAGRSQGRPQGRPRPGRFARHRQEGVPGGGTAAAGDRQAARSCRARTATWSKKRTRLINKLKAQIRRYYPAFLEAAPDLGRTWALDLWTLAPTPGKARRVRLSSVEAVLRKSRARTSAEDVLAALRDKPVPTAPGTAEAVAESAGRIVRRLKALNAEIKEIRTEIGRAVDRVGTMEGGQAVGILRSVPGIGATVLAVILSEAFDSVRKAELQALRCYFGLAPVTKRSGRTVLVQRRLAANGRLRNAAHHWAMAAIQRDKTSRAKYHALRSRGT